MMNRYMTYIVSAKDKEEDKVYIYVKYTIEIPKLNQNISKRIKIYKNRYDYDYERTIKYLRKKGDIIEHINKIRDFDSEIREEKERPLKEVKERAIIMEEKAIIKSEKPILIEEKPIVKEEEIDLSVEDWMIKEEEIDLSVEDWMIKEKEKVLSVEDWMIKEEEEDFSQIEMSQLKQIIKDKEKEFTVRRKAYEKVKKYVEILENITESTTGKKALQEIKYVLSEYMRYAEDIRNAREI
ncbi:hypothetical protein CL6EHI_174570 [Entamoeba histolytica]|nr:hypothetical protein CL6EHI_174570 [Entamoeba histolytica]